MWRCNYLGTLESTESLELPGEARWCYAVSLRSSSTPNTVPVFCHPSLNLHMVYVSQGQKKKKKNTTCPLNIRGLCSDCWVLPLITKLQKNSWAVIVGALLVHLPLWLKIPSPSEMIPRKFEGQRPTFSLFFSSLPFRRENLNAKACKGIIINGQKC